MKDVLMKLRPKARMLWNPLACMQHDFQ